MFRSVLYDPWCPWSMTPQHIHKTENINVCWKEHMTIHLPIGDCYRGVLVDLQSLFLQRPLSGCCHKFSLSVPTLSSTHSLLVQCGIPHLPHCSYEEQMRIGGMKGDQQWGDKPWDGRVRGRAGDGEIDRKGEETVGETKQGAEHVCRVTRHEPGWIQVKRLRDGNRGGEGEEDK